MLLLAVFFSLAIALPLHHLSPIHDDSPFISLASRVEGASLAVNVDTSSGAYEVLVDGEQWLASDAIAFHLNGKWYSTADKSLVLKDSSTGEGHTQYIGDYKSISLFWVAGDTPINTTFMSYTDQQALAFQVNFPQGAQKTSLNTNEDVITAFPHFTSFNTSLNYFTFQGMFASPAVGKLAEKNMPGGIEGGPVFLYDASLRTLAISALDTFMTSHHVWSGSLNNDLTFGINGQVLELPVDFTSTTLLLRNEGIRDSVLDWGLTLSSVYQKKPTPLDGDEIIANLGYWTDDGGYYWYNTEPNKTYQQTMVDVGTYIESIDLPVKYIQLDSWWYYKGKNDGVYTWTPQPAVFPNGMEYVQEHLSMPFALHNRYFAPDTPYQKNYTMIVEDYCALPQDEQLFHDIMALSKQWGNKLYEQDWLITTYEKMIATQNNVTTASFWLDSMGRAAASLNMTIQYCMELPIHLMQSVLSQAVTQARASNDYVPGTTQWTVGYSSLLIWSLGLIPFRDDFWTTPSQPNCYNMDGHNTYCYEPNVYLMTLTGALTAGPIGPSDQIGKIDKTLLMRTSRNDGVLLKADYPAMPLDVVFSSTFENPSIIQLWEASSTIAGFQFFYLFAADLSSSLIVKLSDLPASPSATSYAAYVAFDYFEILSNSTSAPQMFFINSTEPLVIPSTMAPGLGNATVQLRYYVIAPVPASGECIILGELNKFITVSAQRVVAIEQSNNGQTVTLQGAANEQIDFYFLKATDNPSFDVQSITLDEDGTGQVACSV